METLVIDRILRPSPESPLTRPESPPRLRTEHTSNKQSKVKVRKYVTKCEETRDAGFVSRSSLPLQEGTSAFGEVWYHKGYRSHKGRHEGFTLFSSQEHHQGVLNSPFKVLFEVAQPSHKVGVTPQHGGSQLHQGARSRLPPPRCSTRGVPTTRNLPHKDPHKRRPRTTRFPKGNYTKTKFLW